MEAGLGIGGLAIGKDEVATSAFDLFSPIEIEHSITTHNAIHNAKCATMPIVHPMHT